MKKNIAFQLKLKFKLEFMILLAMISFINLRKIEEIEQKNFILIPFKSYFPKYDYDNNYNKAFINSLVRRKFFLNVENESGQKLEMILNTNEPQMHTRNVIAVIRNENEEYYEPYNTVTSDICTFNYKNSKSYEFLTAFNHSFYSIKNTCYAKEKLFLFQDFNLKEKKLFDIEFIHSSNETNICFFACLQIAESLVDLKVNLLIQLKNLINSNAVTWSLKFTSPDDGFLIFGDIIDNDKLKFYNENIKDNYLPLQIYAYSKTDIYWKLYFDKIIFGDYVIKKDSQIYFYMNFQTRFITVPKIYFNEIKNKYFLINEDETKFICFEETIEFFFSVIYCNKKDYLSLTDNYKKLPNLDLFAHRFGVNFTFTPKDLFLEKDDKLYFYIAYNSHRNEEWEMGTIFLEKYITVFNNEETTLNILQRPDGYEEEKEKVVYENNKTKYTIIIILGIILSGAVFGFLGIFYGKKIYAQRKKKANELNDDDYDYNPQSINENNNEKFKNDRENFDNQNTI